MKKKQLETLLYSVAGVVAMLVIILLVNFIVGTSKKRIDLTHEKLYTLSEGTRKILKSLDPKDKLEIRFYFTQGEKEIDPGIKSYAQHVEDLIAEYKKAAGGKIRIKKLNPKPDTDAEDSAHLDGIEGQMFPSGDVLYFGLAIDYLGEKVALPLPPQRERLLEYDISRAITKVLNPQKAILGIMTPLPMFGMPANPMMARMGQQPQEPWVIISELQRDFTVRQVPMTADKIDDDIKVLFVAHPKDISETAQYAIDQFIMRGGKLIAFIDGLCIMDHSTPQQNPMMPAMSSSSLDKLLKAWGITFDTSKVAADRNFTSRFLNRNQQPEAAPAVLSVKPAGINKDDPVTAQIDSLLLPFAGTFSGTPPKEIKETVLLKTTPDSQLVEGFLAQMSGEQISKDFKASGTAYPLAIRLFGKFKTAFPDGKPKDTSKTDDKKDEAKKDEPKPADSLKESKTETTVVLVGDADMLYDQFCVSIQNFFGQKFIQPRNGNLNLAQNLIEQMAGDENLIAVRSRATLNRPFEVIDQMQAKAEDAFRAKRKELEDGLRDTQQKLNELQAAKKEKGQQSLILSADQQAEIKKFREKEAQAKTELREVKKKLKRETESLETRIKLYNIAGVPFLVAGFGIALAIYKGQRAKKR